MKKIAIICILLVVTAALCSCQINWFGETAEAPWYVIAIPVAVIMVVGYWILMSTTFVCPDCNTEFKPKWYHLFVTVHFCGKRLAKCPKCGRFGYCARKK